MPSPDSSSACLLGGHLPRRHRTLRGIALILAVLPEVTFARPAGQTASAAIDAQANRAGKTDIVVTGTRAAAQSSIDRKTYNIGHDLQAASGSAADVLRNLPSVDVDAQGNVSLRGDPNVQILIDGKPSTTTSAANRSDTLEQFPANAIDHIEVITNPSARFKPDGSAGIINIVTKKNAAPGVSGSVQASVGNDGRFNIGGKISARTGPLTLSANASLRRDERYRPYTDRRTSTDPVTGAKTLTTQDSLFRGEKLWRILDGGIDYDLDPNDRLSASGSHTHRTGRPSITQHNRVTGPSGILSSDYERDGGGPEDESDSEISGKYRHTFARKGQAFTLDLRRGETIENETRRFTDHYAVPDQPDAIDQQSPHLDEVQRELTAEYSQPLWGGSILVGYDLQRDDDDYRDRGFLIDPVSGSLMTDPTRTTRFVYGRTIHAGYVTYDRTLAKRLSAIVGLRLEQAITSTDQVDLGLRGRNGYFRAYPTLHLQYELSDSQSLKLSYSERVVRPEPEDLNPYPVFSDPLNLRAGNPDLKPQETRSYEAGYQYRAHGTALEATLFLRQNRNVFTDVSRFISPTELLTTKENLGKSNSYGVDFSGNGKITRKLSWRLSGTAYRTMIDASNLGFNGTRTAWGLTAKAGADFQLAKPDLFQVSGSYSGKRLTPQGFRLPSVTANIGYRHKFANGLSAVFSITDLFDSQRERTEIGGMTLTETSTRRNTRRTFSLALTLPFGGNRAKADAPISFEE